MFISITKDFEEKLKKFKDSYFHVGIVEKKVNKY